MTPEGIRPGAVCIVKWGREEVQMKLERKNEDGTFYATADKFDANVDPKKILRVVGWERV